MTAKRACFRVAAVFWIGCSGSARYFFVLVARLTSILGPARLDWAGGRERPGPLGQVVGYWPRLVARPGPAEFPARPVDPAAGPAQRPSAGRQPSRVFLAGWILSRRMALLMGCPAACSWAFCWFGSIALIDRSGGRLDLIVGLATLATLDRLMTSGTGWLAGSGHQSRCSGGRLASRGRDSVLPSS